MRIPFSQLRFVDRPEQVWGLDLNRFIPDRNEDDFWVFVPKSRTGWASYFGNLEGIQGIHPSRRLELMPYVASNGTFSGDPGRGNPFDDGSKFEGRVGGDLKMGLGPNLTLDGTVNPDFGQVEADPAEVNLSAFETFFDEKRPFFTEGSQLLRGNGPSYFYSRRVGASPPGDASVDNGYVEVPKTSTILGAAKVTGRLASGTSIGVLGALTGREYARTYDGLQHVYDRQQVAARAGYGVLRLQQQFGPNQSTAGLSLTGVRREVSPSLAALVSRQAYTGGGDWNLRSKGGEYALSGYAGFSWVQGDSLDIMRVQRSSAHYFQRPDVTYTHYDPRRTSLSGYTASLTGARQNGTHWLGQLGGSIESPGFELNDAGRLGSADDIDTWANVQYRDTKPGRVFRDYDLSCSINSGWDFAGWRQYTGLGTTLAETWKNFVHSYVGFDQNLQAFSDNITRGGPAMGTNSSWDVYAGVNSNFASQKSWSLNGDYARGQLGGHAADVNGHLGFRPGNRWELGVDPGFSRSMSKRQYVATVDGGRPETYGRRYIFSTIERTTISTQLRLNYAFTPDLTLEAYAEPFAASGHYSAFGELPRGGSRDLRFYGSDGTTLDRRDGTLLVTDGTSSFTIDDPDFNALSFRSNLVLRWEWHPGSTLFLVWQQGRGASQLSSGRVGLNDVWDSLSSEGDQFVAVKASYWLPVN
jgi:hypothetical protein